MTARRLGVTAVFTVASVVSAAGGAGAVASTPTVAAITGGGGKPVVATTSFDLGAVGYEAARSSRSPAPRPRTRRRRRSPPTASGPSRPSTTAPYATRIVVYRPKKAKDFNGTVVAEWLNVSGGADAGPDWVLTHTELIREGTVWVGVSAQAVGLNATKAADPARYAAVPPHPGDSFSYDMYSQAGQAIRDDAATVLGGLKPKRVLAMGESQSAGRMVTYIDAVHPIAKVYDGFLVHSRGAGAPGLASGATPRGAGAEPDADPRRPRRTGDRVPDRDRRRGQQPRVPSGRHQGLPAVGGRGHLALRLLRARGRARPTPATVRAR